MSEPGPRFTWRDDVAVIGGLALVLVGLTLIHPGLGIALAGVLILAVWAIMKECAAEE